jgi:hypothetical protein
LFADAKKKRLSSFDDSSGRLRAGWVKAIGTKLREFFFVVVADH